MTGSSLQKWKHRKVTARIGSHIHVEVIAEEIAFPVGIPAPVTVWLRIMALTVVGSPAFFPTVASTFFFAVVRQYGQECRYRQEPDDQV